MSEEDKEERGFMPALKICHRMRFNEMAEAQLRTDMKEMDIGEDRMYEAISSEIRMGYHLYRTYIDISMSFTSSEISRGRRTRSASPFTRRTMTTLPS